MRLLRSCTSYGFVAAMVFVTLDAHAQAGEVEAPSTAPLETAASLSGPIVAVRIEPPIMGEDPWARSGLTRGTPFSPARARDALRHALASGTLASAELTVRAEGAGVAVVIRGERRYRLASLELVGTIARDVDLVREETDLHVDTMVTERDVIEALRRVEAAYREQGYPEARVRSEWRDGAVPGTRHLTLLVTEATALRIRAIELPGIDAALLREAREAIGVAVGDLAAPQRVRVGEEALLTFLRRRGYLDTRVTSSVENVDGGVLLRYAVSAGVRCTLAWFGVYAMSEEALVEALRLGEEQGFTDATLSSFASRVQDFYNRRAFYDARVRASVRREGDLRRIGIHVNEGRQVLVREVRFTGASVLTASEMRVMVDTAALAELPSEPTLYRGRVYRERTYTPGVYATAAQRIVEAYRERGYLDATVSTPVVARVETPSGPRLDVTFHVTEGPCSLVEEITFTGNRAQPSAALAEALGLRLGVPVSYRGLGDARVRLADWYHERGYAFASVEPEVERSPDHTRARIRVVVHEGPRVRIARVEVRGNTVTRESVIRTRLALREGDTVSISALRTSQRQLYELGVFTSVNVGLLDGDIEAPLKTLLVQVVEDRRFSLEMRGGFSFGQGARAAVEAALINIGGVGMSLTVRPEVGYLLALPFVAPEPPTGINVRAWDAERLTGRAPLSLGFPHIPGLGPRFSASVDLVASRQLQPWSYSLVTLGLGGTLTWRPISRLSLSFTSELQRIDVGLFGQSSIDETLRRIYEDCINEGVPMTTCNQRRLAQRQNLLRYEPGRSDLAAARVGIVWDGRDNPLTPRSGVYASLTTELLSLLSFDQAASTLRPADTTLHMEGRITGYIPVGSVVVAMSARAGRNFTLGGADRTHPSRLFWLGGANSMRGWTQNQLLPQDTIDDARAAPPELRDSVLAGVQGGEFYLNAVLDIRVPLGLCVLAGVCAELGFFSDVGNVWRRAPSEVADWFNFRVSPGVGLRFTSPVGIIAFDFGLALPYYPELGESVFQTMQFYLGNTL